MTKKQLIALGIMAGAALLGAASSLGLKSTPEGFTPPAPKPDDSIIGWVGMGPCVTAKYGTRTVYSIGGVQVNKEQCDAANNEVMNSPWGGIEG